MNTKPRTGNPCGRKKTTTTTTTEIWWFHHFSDKLHLIFILQGRRIKNICYLNLSPSQKVIFSTPSLAPTWVGRLAVFKLFQLNLTVLNNKTAHLPRTGHSCMSSILAYTSSFWKITTRSSPLDPYTLHSIKIFYSDRSDIVFILLSFTFVHAAYANLTRILSVLIVLEIVMWYLFDTVSIKPAKKQILSAEIPNFWLSAHCLQKETEEIQN